MNLNDIWLIAGLAMIASGLTIALHSAAPIIIVGLVMTALAFVW